MDEIEVKILEVNRQEVESKLLSLGANKVFDGIVDSSLFNFEDNRIKNAKSTCRLRKVGSESFLAFKEFVPHPEVKVRKEYEIKVSDFDTMKLILETIGLHEWQHFKKHRPSYEIDDVKFEFDLLEGEWSHIPEFLEIEGPDVKTIYKYVELLGFKKEDCKSWGGRELINHYKNRKN